MKQQRQSSMDHTNSVTINTTNNNQQIRSRANSINISTCSAAAVAVSVAAVGTVANNNTNAGNNINSNNNPNNQIMKNPVSIVDAIHFQSSQQQQQHGTVTTTTAATQAVITVVSPSTESTDMISTQPVVVQVSSGGANHQYIAVSTTHPNNGHPHHHQPHHHPHSLKLETDDNNDANTSDNAGQQHSTQYDDYNSIYSNGSNSTGPMAYYVTDQYTPTAYYNPTNLSETYVVMDPNGGEAQINPSTQTSQPIATNLQTQNIIQSEEDYNKSYQPTRMSVQPQTVNWLHENYETADGVSLPRSTLYSHYQQHCRQNNIEPVNAASFGKLIRSVFVGLRTRRLGTRGNSKYHYYGIRVKANSILNDNSNGNGVLENNHHTMPPVKRPKVNNNISNNNSQTNNNKNNSNNATINDLNHNMIATTTKESLQQHLGNANQLLDDVWPTPSSNPQQSNEQTMNESEKFLNVFTKNYRTHYDRIIHALSELNFHEVENIWLQFWQQQQQLPPPRPLQSTTANVDGPTSTVTELMDLECLKDLTKTDFSNWIAQTDYTMYNSIISNLLLPNLLKPIPQVLTQQIRNFAKCIQKWMINALQGYPDGFIRMKTSAVSALSHMLRRYTSLNHLSTAACAVLKNPQQVQQMINDLNKVDFKNVQEQASWVCQCDEEIVHQIENSFKTFLQESNPYERWAQWCEQVLDMSLPNNNTIAAKQFFFKWEFYSSLVMRDLTLRSAQSFGSFHLIRLLFDEYIFYLVEQRIAKTTGTTPLQMLGELASSSSNITNNINTSTISSVPVSVTSTNTTTQNHQSQSITTNTTTVVTNHNNPTINEQQQQYSETIVNGQMIP